MSFKPVQKQSLADAVFDQLRNRILCGELKPGESLPAERALAEMLDVNRGAVREALKRLEQARLVAIRHGGATTVLDFRDTAGTDLLGALLVRDGELDLRVARSILEMRSALAPSIARLCARRGGQVVTELDPIIDEMEQAKGDLEALQMASLRYWAALVTASDNIAYQLAFNSLSDAYEHFAHLLTAAMGDEFEATADYRLLREAIASGNEDKAAEIGARIVHLGESALSALLDVLENLAKEKAL